VRAVPLAANDLYPGIDATEGTKAERLATRQYQSLRAVWLLS